MMKEVFRSQYSGVSIPYSGFCILIPDSRYQRRRIAPA